MYELVKAEFFCCVNPAFSSASSFQKTEFNLLWTVAFNFSYIQLSAAPTKVHEKTKSGIQTTYCSLISRACCFFKYNFYQMPIQTFFSLQPNLDPVNAMSQFWICWERLLTFPENKASGWGNIFWGYNKKDKLTVQGSNI